MTAEAPIRALLVKIGRVEHIDQSPFDVVIFTVGSSTRQVVGEEGRAEEGARMVFIPNGVYVEHLDSEIRARGIAGHRSDGVLVNYKDAAALMVERAGSLLETDEEREIFADKEADYLFDAALGALYELPLGVDVGAALGVLLAGEEESNAGA